MRVLDIFDVQVQRVLSYVSRLPQYSLPRSVNIRSIRTPCSSKNGNTRSLSVSAAVMACFRSYNFTNATLVLRVDEGLLINPPHALQICTSIVRVLRA